MALHCGLSLSWWVSLSWCPFLRGDVEPRVRINKYRGGTSHTTFLSALIIIVFVVVVGIVGHLYSFQPQKPRFSSFENNMGRTDRQMDGPTDGLTDGWMD